MPCPKGKSYAKVRCKGLDGMVCDGVIAIHRNLSGYCRTCSSRLYYRNITSIRNGIFNKSTEWFVDILGIKTRFHGDV